MFYPQLVKAITFNVLEELHKKDIPASQKKILEVLQQLLQKLMNHIVVDDRTEICVMKMTGEKLQSRRSTKASEKGSSHA